MITLLRPPIISSRTSFSVPVSPPLALAYLAAVLEKEGLAVDAIDALGEGIDSIQPMSRGRKAQGLSFERIVERINPATDVLAVSIMFSQEWPLIRELILMIKRAHPRLTILAGGEHITALPEASLSQCEALDYCALGEGEETLPEFVAALRKDGDVRAVAGLCYRNGDGFARTSPRQRVKDLSTMPWPAWHALPIETYLASGYGMGINNGRNMPMLATRGCPYQCTFCSNPVMYGQRYVMRPPADVINEMKHYVETFKADFIEFYDLTAIIRKDWIKEFCALYLKDQLTIGWSLPSGTRSEALDTEVLSLLYQANCRYLVYAPESGSPVTLKQIKKEVHLDRLVASATTAVRFGINTRCNLIIGFPKETLKQVFETLKFQIKLAWLGIDDAPIYLFSPYPGSALFEYLRSSGQIRDLDEEYFDGLLAQMDLKSAKTYCETLDGKTLRLYRIAGMSLFYVLTYLFRPWRLYRSFVNIFIRKRTNTVFEQRLLEMLMRSDKHKSASREFAPETTLQSLPSTVQATADDA